MNIKCFTSFLITLVLLSMNLRLTAAVPPDPDKDSALSTKLEDAKKLFQEKNYAATILQCDAVIQPFKKAYSERKEMVFCSNSPEESMLYVLIFAGKNKSSISLPPTWAAAHFLKGYVLQETGKQTESKKELESAVALSPYQPQYLCELAHVYVVEKNWQKAKELYQEAEDHYGFGNPAKFFLGVAKRGLGYVFVELGDFPAAEKKYLECLERDPDDPKAKAELDYVRAQIIKKKKLEKQPDI